MLRKIFRWIGSYMWLWTCFAIVLIGFWSIGGFDPYDPSLLPPTAMPTAAPLPTAVPPPSVLESASAVIINILLLVVVIAVMLVMFLVVLMAVTTLWHNRRRLAPTVQAQAVGGMVVDVQPMPVPPRPKSAPRRDAPPPAVVEAMPVVKAAAPSRVVLETPAPTAWTVLAPKEVMALLKETNWEDRVESMVGDAPKRILQLQQAFGCPTARYAPDYSVVVFPHTPLGLGAIQRKAGPLSAVLTRDDDGVVCAVVSFLRPPAPVVAAAPTPETLPTLAAVSITTATAELPAAPAPATERALTLDEHWRAIAHPARLSPQLPLGIEAFLSQVFVVAGRRRTGKSYTLGVVLEELCAYAFPFAVVDFEGETFGLRASYPVVICGRSNTTTVDRMVLPGAARALAVWAHEERRQVILDLSDFTKTEQTQFVRNFAEGVWLAATTAAPRRPFAFVVDEAHEVYPQQGKSEATEIMDRLVLRGGKWGISVGLATQRPANLNMNGRTQAGIALLHLVEQKRDLDAYADILPKEWTEARLATIMPQLRQGTVIAKVTENAAPTRVAVATIRKRRTPHMGYTPGMDDTAPPAPRRRAIAPAVLVALDAALAAVENEAPTADGVQHSPLETASHSPDTTTTPMLTMSATTSDDAPRPAGTPEPPKVVVPNVKPGDARKILHCWRIGQSNAAIEKRVYGYAGGTAARKVAEVIEAGKHAGWTQPPPDPEETTLPNTPPPEGQPEFALAA